MIFGVIILIIKLVYLVNVCKVFPKSVILNDYFVLFMSLIFIN